MDAIADTPVALKTALTDVATSLIVDPSDVVTDELPSIPCIVNVSAWTKFAVLELTSSTAYALRAKLSFLPSVSVYQGNKTRFNFGGFYHMGQALASGNSDENGYGSFEYAPPSGFYALCSKNLGQYGG